MLCFDGPEIDGELLYQQRIIKSYLLLHGSVLESLFVRAGRSPPRLLPHTAGLGCLHRIAVLTSECLAEFGHIAYHAIHPKFWQRMWIGLREHSGELWPHILTPDLGIANKKLLRLRISVFFFIERDVPFREIVKQGQIGKTQPAVIGGIFTERQLAI